MAFKSVSTGTMRGLATQNQLAPNWNVAPQWVDATSLASGAAATYVLPTGINHVRLTPTVGQAYGNLTADATIPGATLTGGSGSFPIISQTYLAGIGQSASLSLIAGTATTIVIEGWA